MQSAKTSQKTFKRPEIKILKNIQSDIALLKQKIISMDDELDAISSDLHRELNPEFLKKLEKIQKQKGVKFGSIKEFEEYFSE